MLSARSHAYIRTAEIACTANLLSLCSATVQDKRMFSDLGVNLYSQIFGSSDGKGNITVVDVKREKFEDEVKAAYQAVDSTSPDKKTGDENAVYTTSDTSEVQAKRRYGFRVRRLKNRRDDEWAFFASFVLETLGVLRPVTAKTQSGSGLLNCFNQRSSLLRSVITLMK